MDLYTSIGLLCVVFVGVNFILQIGKSVPILELMLLIAGLQWIVGPFIEYNSPSLHYKYYMYVPQDVYMSYVVPAYVLFSIVILWGLKKYQGLKIPIERLSSYKNY